MLDERRTAVIVGILFIVGTAAGVSSVACTSSILGSTDYLARISANENVMKLGALFVLVMGFALAFVPVLMFPILKRRSEALALGYAVFRGALETVIDIAIAVIWLTLVALGRNAAAAGALGAGAEGTGAAGGASFQAAGAALRGAADASQLIAVFAFGIGAVFFYWMLYRSRLIPQWLSAWGLIAIALHLATGFLQLFDAVPSWSAVQTAMNFPIFLQEMVMAVWLIAKGFDGTAAAAATA